VAFTSPIGVLRNGADVDVCGSRAEPDPRADPAVNEHGVDVMVLEERRRVALDMLRGPPTHHDVSVKKDNREFPRKSVAASGKPQTPKGAVRSVGRRM